MHLASANRVTSEVTSPVVDMPELEPGLQAASSRRSSSSTGQAYRANPQYRNDVLSSLSAVGSAELDLANRSGGFRRGYSVQSDTTEQTSRRVDTDDHKNLAAPCSSYELGNSLQDYSRLAVIDRSATDRSSSEGNETSILRDVPGYVSAAERRRLLSADPMIPRHTSSRSGRQSSSLGIEVLSPTVSRRPLQDFANDPSASSVWTDSLNHYGLCYDSLLDNPSLVSTSGVAMREMLDHKVTYENSDHKKARAESYDEQSVRSTETEYHMLPPAMSSPSHQIMPEQQHQQTWRHQTSGLGVSCSMNESSDANAVHGVPSYATPPLRASRENSATNAATGYSSPLTSVTATASHSPSVAVQTSHFVDRRVVSTHMGSGHSGSDHSRRNGLAGPNVHGKDDAYLPMDSFSDTSCLSMHTDDSTEKHGREGNDIAAMEQLTRGQDPSTVDPVLADVSSGTLSTISLTSSGGGESDNMRSPIMGSSRDRVPLHAIKTGPTTKVAACASSSSSHSTAVVPSLQSQASASSTAATRPALTYRTVAAVSRARALVTALPTSMAAAKSTSALVSSRLDHIEAMVMKALEKRQPDVPDAVLQHSISETIRQMQPGVSPSKTAEPVVMAVSGESALISDQTSLALPSAGLPAVTAPCSSRDGKLDTACATRASLSTRTVVSGLPGADTTGDQRALVQPLKDLSLNLSLLPDRTLPAFPAFSSATHFLSEQLKCRAGEKTPGRIAHRTANQDEMPPPNLSDQENMPKQIRDTSSEQNAKVFDRGSLLHLQPYKPSGSRALTYVTAHSMDDTLSMTTTVESTHTDSDDARPPFLPVDAFGSRSETAHLAPGIYGTRRRKVAEQNQNLPVVHRQLRRDPCMAGNGDQNASECADRPEQVTEELPKNRVPATDSHRQPSAAERGSAAYVQNLRDRADSLLKLKDQLAGRSSTGHDASDGAGPASRAAKEMVVDPRPTATVRELCATNLRSLAPVSGPGELQAPSIMSRTTYARASSLAHTAVAREPRSHSPAPSFEHAASCVDDRQSSGELCHHPQANINGNAAHGQSLSSDRAELGSTADGAHFDPAAGGDTARASVIASSSSRAPVATTKAVLRDQPRFRNHAASDRLVPDAARMSSRHSAATGRVAAAITRGPAERRVVGVPPHGSIGAAAADRTPKPNESLVGSRRTQSLSPNRSPKVKVTAGLSSRPGTVRSSSTSPSPPRYGTAGGNPLRQPPAVRQLSSPVRALRSPTRSDRETSQGSGTKVGRKTPVARASTTSAALRSKLADVIKDRQMTYRVLIDELTNAEDAHKRSLLNQAWDEINRKKSDETSLSDEKLERLCDLLRNPLRHLVTRNKDNSDRRIHSNDVLSGPDRHLEALRSAVLQQKSANIPRSQTASHSTNHTSRAGTGEGVKTAFPGENDHDNDDNDDTNEWPVASNGRRSGDFRRVSLTTGKEDGGILSAPTASFSNTARAAACQPPIKPGVEEGGVLPAKDMCTQAVQTSFVHHQSDVCVPAGDLTTTKDGSGQQPHHLAQPKASVPALNSVGRHSLKHKRQDAVMWYQPISRKSADANTYEKARQRLSDHRGCSWFVPLGQPKPWKRSPVERRANRLGQEPWYPSVLAAGASGAFPLLREGTGSTASGGPFISSAERRLLQELDQAWHGSASRHFTSRAGRLGMEGTLQPDEASTSSSLQEAFARRKQEFVSRSRERLRRVALRSEERAINSLHDAEREKLFGLRAPLTAAAGEKLPGRGRAVTTTSAVVRRPPQPSPSYGGHATVDGSRAACQRRRQLGHFTLQSRRAAISKREMYDRTRRMCTELPEERQRDVTLRRRQECAAHRSRARLFNKKVLHTVLRKACVMKKTRK